MFTGLVENLGKIANITYDSSGARISYSCDFSLPETIKIGDSISVNGVCLTITRINENVYSSDIMLETLDKTNLKFLKKGDNVNLERAMQITSRFDGHIVSGHIDTIAKVKSISKEGFSKKITFVCNNDLIVLKGSICVNGISLTVSNLTSDGFEVSLIPTTIENTNLKNIKIGDMVNIEYDLIGKYVKKIINNDINKQTNCGITEDFLKKNGF